MLSYRVQTVTLNLTTNLNASPSDQTEVISLSQAQRHTTQTSSSNTFFTPQKG